MISIKYFGAVPQGAVHAARITNSKGNFVEVLTLGATLHSLVVSDKNGAQRDVILGYDTPMDYLSQSGYIGATIGRYANRIDGPSFVLNGKKFELADTSGNGVTLHGGFYGFNKKIFAVSLPENAVFARPGKSIELPQESGEFTADCSSLRFSTFSPDMEEGYPGNLFMTVAVTFTDDDCLELSYEATSDKDTVFNVTNHSYFSLSGQNSGRQCLDTVIKINSCAITPTDIRSVPHGSYMDVTGTTFDFRTPKPIGRDIDDGSEQMVFGKGYDHNFVIDGYVSGAVREAATAYSPESGIKMTCLTDLPGMQFYTANYLTERTGKLGAKYSERCAFCFETQKYPNSPNIPEFPSAVLKGGELYRTVTKYVFTI